MKTERIHNGREITRSEVEAIRKIIQETNIEVEIAPDGDIVLQAISDYRTMEIIGRCDLRRVAAYAAEITSQANGDTEIFALAGLFSKCAQIVLDYTDPRNAQDEDSEILGGAVRLFAGDDEENSEEE